MAVRLLVLEDDVRLCEAYSRRLRAESFAVDEVGTIGRARHALLDVDYDCLVLDRLVPDGDSLELVAELSLQSRRPWVLVLSALGDGDHRVRGLEAGADDYMPKPVRLEELALRVRKLVLRPVSAMPGPLRLGRVTLDRGRREVLLDGARVHLTPTQYAVVEYLAANRDRLVTTQELLDHCWDRNVDVFASPVHSHISRLRRTFGAALRFDSVRGAGYVIRAPGADGPAS
jgi:two-component system copper resistance phosphate regulon response regulator CusR